MKFFIKMIIFCAVVIGVASLMVELLKESKVESVLFWGYMLGTTTKDVSRSLFGKG